jgi:hypothetical protein
MSEHEHNMDYDVFISYASDDKATAEAVCAALENAGIRCWYAPRDITPGQDWGEAIMKAIGAGRLMVVVFSSHSNTSDHVKREVSGATSKGITIIPFRIENVPPTGSMEFYLGTHHWLDAYDSPLEKHNKRLLDTVNSILKGAPTPPVEYTHAPPAPEDTTPKRQAKGGVSNWWWSLPIITGFVGGIITWVFNRSANRRKALYMLTLGILISLLWAIPIVILSSKAPYITPAGPLTLSQAIFCAEEPLDAGIYTAKADNLYYVGDTVWIYYEVWSYAGKPEEQGYSIWIEAADRILDPAGKIHYQWPVYEYRDISDTYLDPDFVAFWDMYIIQPETQPGQYKFEVTVEDGWTGETASQYGYFTIAPAEPP